MHWVTYSSIATILHTNSRLFDSVPHAWEKLAIKTYFPKSLFYTLKMCTFNSSHDVFFLTESCLKENLVYLLSGAHHRFVGKNKIQDGKMELIHSNENRSSFTFHMQTKGFLLPGLLLGDVAH